MITIQQQIAAQRRRIAADEAAVAAGDDLHLAEAAKQRLPRDRQELEKLCTTAHKGAAGIAEMRCALNKMVNEMPVGGRELSLAITHAEDAIHRLRNHLGTAAEPS
jgi:hypothetical protein